MTTPTPTPPPVAPQKLPKAGFIWGPIIFVVTAIIGISMFATSFIVLANSITDFRSVDAGQTVEMRLGTGEWFVFGGGPSRSALREVNVYITDANGDVVTPKPSSDTYSAENDGMRYESFGSFDVTTAGVYSVEVQGPVGTNAKIGQISLGSFLALLIGGIVIGAIGFVVALILLIVTAVRRGRAKRALFATQYGAVGAAPVSPAAPSAPMPPPVAPVQYPPPPPPAPPAPPAPPVVPTDQTPPPPPPAPPT